MNMRTSRSRRPRWGRTLLAGAVALCVVLGRLLAHGGEDHGDAEHGAATANGPMATTISVVKEQQFAIGLLTEPAARHPMGVGITATGRVVPRTDAVADVIPPIAGRVVGGRLPRLGERVRRGEVLFRVQQVLAPTERTALRLEQVKAKAEVDAAQREVDRLVRLEGVVAAKQLLDARARLASAREAATAIAAQLQGAGTAVAVVAPISGTITAADIADGEILDASRRAYSIANLDHVWVEADVFEADLPKVQGVRAVEVTTPAYPGRTFAGTLYRLGSVVDPSSRAITVLLDVRNPDELLKLNMSTSVVLAAGAAQEEIAIPQSALVRSGARTVVFVHTAPEEFQVRDVRTTGAAAGGYVAASGIGLGERVVVSGAHQLKAVAGLQ